jgi:hypothetical protein
MRKVFALANADVQRMHIIPRFLTFLRLISIKRKLVKAIIARGTLQNWLIGIPQKGFTFYNFTSTAPVEESVAVNALITKQHLRTATFYLRRSTLAKHLSYDYHKAKCSYSCDILHIQILKF